jgi:putative pyruvate formate lyase activating enzyme
LPGPLRFGNLGLAVVISSSTEERAMDPAYLELHAKGILMERVRGALQILRSCVICPRMCKVNRLEGQLGYCRTGRLAKVSSFSPHFGEESPLVGRGGSGTIFFTHCNLLCIFCQNYDISHLGIGEEVDAGLLARMMIRLQEQGCHNINFVTPTHVVPQILEALPLAIEGGLRVPLVYNTGGYDRVETLRLLEGVVDIYMPDIKFLDRRTAQRMCNAPDYPETVKAAIREMHRQVGDLRTDPEGIATRGLLVRHLVMPEGLAQTREAMEFLADEISKETYVNVMDQYRPCGEAHSHRDLSRRITREEYAEALEAARRAGLHRLDSRERPLIFRIW